MTFIKACPNCSLELDLDRIDIEDTNEVIECPECYNTISIPNDFWETER